MLILCEKNFDSWLSYIYIHKRRCGGVDGTCPTPGMGLFAKIVKEFKPLTVFAESSVSVYDTIHFQDISVKQYTLSGKKKLGKSD